MQHTLTRSYSAALQLTDFPSRSDLAFYFYDNLPFQWNLRCARAYLFGRLFLRLIMMHTHTPIHASFIKVQVAHEIRSESKLEDDGCDRARGPAAHPDIQRCTELN